MTKTFVFAKEPTYQIEHYDSTDNRDIDPKYLREIRELCLLAEPTKSQRTRIKKNIAPREYDGFMAKIYPNEELVVVRDVANNRVAGVISVEHIRSNTVIHINALAVHPDYQRRTIAKTIIDIAERLAPEGKDVEFRLVPKEVLTRFYKKEGATLELDLYTGTMHGKAKVRPHVRP